MIKILKYLKESWISVIVIVVLLVMQAMGDLSLPDYTSKIVNVGIQQGGIEKASPNALRKSTMDDLLIFTDADTKILSYYSEVSKDNLDKKEYDILVKKYPVLEKESIYIKNNITGTEEEKLDALISKPMMVLASLNNDEMSTTVKTNMLTQMPEEQKKMMSDMELIDIIKMLPNEVKAEMLKSINEKIDAMQEGVLEQAAISAVKTEYLEMGVNTDNLQIRYIVFSGLKMLGIALGIMIAAIGIMGFSSRVGAKLAKTLREKIFRKVLSFSNKEFTEYSTASLITRSTNDIQQIQNLIAILFRVVIYAPIMGIGGFLKVLNQSDNSMSWIIGVAVVAIMVIIGILFVTAMPKFKKLQDFIDKLNLVMREILTGLPVIRAFNTEKKEEERFDTANKDLTKLNLFVNRAMSLMMPALMLVMNCITVLIVWVGAHKINDGVMQVGNMMAFIQYTIQIVISFLMISMISIILPRASVSAKRITDVLEKEEAIKEPTNPKKPEESKKGFVEFKNVCFKYPDADEEIISDITFTAKPGETTAIIGSTGSGKSTIVNLIPRFYDITSGELLVDGINIKELAKEDLKKIVGFVPQRGVLFSGTIESNIKYGNPDMSDEVMVEAADIAQATEFINSKPNGYKEEIAQGGNNVSGGQKQRLSISRAIAINPEILVFDDSFSALDLKTDSKLRAALNKKTKDKTVIIVAQRISTILNAEQIVVLEEGRIVGMGTHKELMETNETYRQIALSQLSKEELE